MKSKQLIFTAEGKYEIRTVELPGLKDNQALVKVEACGLCTWERDIFCGREKATFPFVGGHEIAGTIVDTAKEIPRNIKIGDCVAVAKWKRCNQCYECRKGFDNQCSEAVRPVAEGVAWGPAGFSEYLIAEAYEIFPLHNIKELHYGALVEPVACVTRSVKRAGANAGDTAVIVGAGLMGLLFLKVLKFRGVKVIVVQRSRYRRELAKVMGADSVINPLEEEWIEKVRDFTGGRGGDAVFYTAGGSEVLNQCLKATAIGGKILIYAPIHSDVPALEADEIHYRELEVIGSVRHDKESFRHAAQIISDNLIHLGDLNLEFGKFENFGDEIEKARNNREIHRILLQWDSNFP